MDHWWKKKSFFWVVRNATYKKEKVALSEVIKTKEDEQYYFDFENIQLSDHFWRSEKQILETSLDYRNSCLSWLSEKWKAENLKRKRDETEQKAKQKADELAKKYKR